MTGDRLPDVTVIVVAWRAGSLLFDCLESVVSRTARSTYEVFLVESSGDGTAEEVRARFPSVRVHASERRLWPGGARNIAIGETTGRIVAFLDADCVAHPGWIDAIADAHREHPVVGGAIGNADHGSTVGWAAYFCEFSEWMPGARPRDMSDMAAANVSYDREVLEGAGPFLERTYGSDTDLHWRLRERGLTIRFVPTIRIDHRCIEDLGRFLRHEFGHGRDFGRVRARWQTPLRRLLGAALFPLVFVRVCAKRLAQHRANPAHLRPLLAASPLVAAGLFFWCLGECAGALDGPR
jgi:GT2 family glycosyltransferase